MGYGRNAIQHHLPASTGGREWHRCFDIPCGRVFSLEHLAVSRHCHRNIWPATETALRVCRPTVTAEMGDPVSTVNGEVEFEPYVLYLEPDGPGYISYPDSGVRFFLSYGPDRVVSALYLFEPDGT